jgi:ribosome-binding protein aMBF1 (putative translation factor)
MKHLESEKKEKQQWLKQFGAHVRKMRIKKGLTGGALSRDLNIDKSNLIRIEKGRVTNKSVKYLKYL